MHHLPDLSPNSQLALYCATILGVGLLVARGILACYRYGTAVRHRYPAAWSDANVRLLERLRISTGLALALTWGCLLIASPRMPAGAPFGFLSALFLIFLLLVSTAWVRLMIPTEWKDTFIGRMKFEHAFGCLLVLWTILLGGSLFAMAKSATSAAERLLHVFGTYA
jgi:hypothetical protein